MIVGYAGSSSRLDIALARFARLYADQTEADHAALVKAADRGIVPIERGLLTQSWPRSPLPATRLHVIDVTQGSCQTRRSPAIHNGVSEGTRTPDTQDHKLA